MLGLGSASRLFQVEVTRVVGNPPRLGACCVARGKEKSRGKEKMRGKQQPHQAKRCTYLLLIFHPASWPRPDQTPTITNNPSRNCEPSPFEARGRLGRWRGAAVCVGGVFPRRRRPAERPALTNQAVVLHYNFVKVLCCD